MIIKVTGIDFTEVQKYYWNETSLVIFSQQFILLFSVLLMQLRMLFLMLLMLLFCTVFKKDNRNIKLVI